MYKVGCRTFLSSVAKAAFALLPSAAIGCGSPDGPSQLLDNHAPMQVDGPVPDEQAVLAQLKNGVVGNPQFKQVSKIFPSSKDPVNVALFISPPDAANDYLKIDPAVQNPDGPNVVLPEGTIIVRAVYNDPKNTNVAAYDALTILTKGPAGFENGFGGWAFGATDPKGNVLPMSAVFPPPDGGVPDQSDMFGIVPGCHAGCHENQRGGPNDYLFGVPMDARL